MYGNAEILCQVDAITAISIENAIVTTNETWINCNTDQILETVDRFQRIEMEDNQDVFNGQERHGGTEFIYLFI